MLCMLLHYKIPYSAALSHVALTTLLHKIIFQTIVTLYNPDLKHGFDKRICCILILNLNTILTGPD